MSVDSQELLMATLPQLHPFCLGASYVHFLDRLSELGGIEVLDYPGAFLTKPRVLQLETAKRVSIQDISSLDQIILLSSHPALLTKVTSLSFIQPHPDPKF